MSSALMHGIVSAKTNMHCCLQAQTRPDYTGPENYWPKKSSKNVRSFTDEQLRAGQSVIGLQAGSNKGASQAGTTMGKQRMIID